MQLVHLYIDLLFASVPFYCGHMKRGGAIHDDIRGKIDKTKKQSKISLVWDKSIRKSLMNLNFQLKRLRKKTHFRKLRA